MYEQIKNNVSNNDYASIYYLKYVADLLNIDYQLTAIDDNLIGTDYYALLLYDKEVNIQDFTKFDDDITAFLMGVDVCEKNDEIKNKLKNIDIFSFENINEFGMLLNVYICDMKKYGIIDSEIENKVINYIEKSKGPFGYEVKGAYDFRTSVYYTNILYILDGGEDIGLR